MFFALAARIMYHAKPQLHFCAVLQIANRIRAGTGLERVASLAACTTCSGRCKISHAICLVPRDAGPSGRAVERGFPFGLSSALGVIRLSVRDEIRLRRGGIVGSIEQISRTRSARPCSRQSIILVKPKGLGNQSLSILVGLLLRLLLKVEEGRRMLARVRRSGNWRLAPGQGTEGRGQRPKREREMLAPR